MGEGVSEDVRYNRAWRATNLNLRPVLPKRRCASDFSCLHILLKKFTRILILFLFQTAGKIIIIKVHGFCSAFARVEKLSLGNQYKSRDSSVSVVTKLVVSQQRKGVCIRGKGKRLFSSRKGPDHLWGSIWPLIHFIPGTSLEVKRPWYEGEHLLP